MPKYTGTVEHKGTTYNTFRDKDGKEWWGVQGRPDSKISPMGGKQTHTQAKKPTTRGNIRGARGAKK